MIYKYLRGSLYFQNIYNYHVLGNLRFELVVLILDNSLPSTDTPQPRESLDATNFGYEYKYSLALPEQRVFLCLTTNNWIGYQINLNI